MPYFFICPVYAVLVLMGLVLGLCLLYPVQTRRYAGYVLWGTIGTIPGFIVANLLFWALFFGVAMALKVPVDYFRESEIVAGTAGVFLIILFVGGLIVANIVGCGSGFLAGCWFFLRIRKKSSSNHAVERTAK